MTNFLLRQLQGYRWRIGVGVVLTFAQVGTDILAAFPLKFILDKVVSDKDPSFPLDDQVIGYFDRIGGRVAGPATEYTTIGIILAAVAMLVAFSTAGAILTFVQIRLVASIGQGLTARLRNQIFAHLERLSLEWHGRYKKGDLVQRVTSNVNDVEKLVTDGVVDMLASVLTLVGMVAVMFAFNWRFALLAIMIVPALFAVVLMFTRAIKSARRKAAKEAAHVADVATEDVAAITEVKAFALEAREARRFGKHVEEHRVARNQATQLRSKFQPIVSLLLAVSTASVVGIGSYVALGNTFEVGPLTIAANTLTIGTLTVFLAYLKQLYSPMRDLSKLTNVINAASSAVERIQEVLNEAPEVTAPQRSYTGQRKLRGDITYKGVVFGYENNRPVLNGIDMHIAAGRKVALVGLSGGGKTTLVKLLPRFYNVCAGSVRIDDRDVRQYPLDVLRQNISFVLQDSVLFEGTVRENLAIGRPDATDDQIITAAKQAHIHDTIMALPKGYDAHVREGGANFSNGQRQRMAIARAIVRDAPILVLDEPTASLDVEAEAEVMQALDQLIGGRTVLMISHRLSTLGHVDEIVVLSEGRIVERGTFEQLRALGGIFATLLAQQNRYSGDGARRSVPDTSKTAVLPVVRETRPTVVLSAAHTMSMLKPSTPAPPGAAASHLEPQRTWPEVPRSAYAAVRAARPRTIAGAKLRMDGWLFMLLTTTMAAAVGYMLALFT